jgi:hypothetical protein
MVSSIKPIKIFISVENSFARRIKIFYTHFLKI